MKKISRRDLLKVLGATVGGLGLQQLPKNTGIKALAQDDYSIYLPTILKSTPPPTPTPIPTSTPTPTSTPIPEPTVAPPTGSPRVVHLYSQSATDWDFGSSWYGDHIDQNVVNAMVNTGLKALTGKSNLTEAWQTLIPDYQPGQGIAIKVNFNNNYPHTSNCCDGSGNIIDSVPQPTLALIAGLVGMGVHQDDIWIFDAIRVIPARFKSVITAQYPSVRFYAALVNGTSCSGNREATFNSTDSSAQINFSHSGLSTDKVPDVLVDAHHLINMPIMKQHDIGGVSLSFKHHFGSIRNPAVLHAADNYILKSAQNPLIDIYQNSNIRNKTRLTVGDGLVGALYYNQKPVRWATFGNDAPNSLFFATDPVAVDCVMYDYLNAEQPIAANGADNYLKLARDAGLGVFEHRNSQGNYSQIDYVRVNL